MNTESTATQGDGPGGDDLRAGLRQMWNAVAPAWGEHAEYIDELASGMTGRMLDLTEPRPGEQVLELACGTGGLGMAAAERVAPGGEVVMSDVAAGMTAIARERADAAGLTNVTTRELDLESIDEAADAYDAVLCREGLMLTSDPARASAEIARVLRPSGRFALSVWGPRERNPWLGLLLDSAGAVLGVPVPPPGVPGPFSLSDRDRLAAVLAGAGLAEVQVDEASVPRSAGSFEEWWQRTVALAGPLAKMLESLPPETRDAIRQRAEEAVRPFATADGGLEFPGVALVASGRAA